MHKDIPQNVWTKVVIGFLFSFFIIWYFSYRLLIGIVFPFLPTTPVLYLTSIFSVLVCLLLVKRTIEIEMKNPDASVSVVAKNPEIEIVQEELTTKGTLNKMVYSMLFTLFLGLPFILISIVRIVSGESSIGTVFNAFMESYWIIFTICYFISLFISFVFIPSLKSWHWTKPQF